MWNPPSTDPKKQPRVVTDVDQVWFSGCHCGQPVAKTIVLNNF
jgi:hypothetical protein